MLQTKAKDWSTVPPPSWECQYFDGFCYNHPSLIEMTLRIITKMRTTMMLMIQMRIMKRIKVHLC